MSKNKLIVFSLLLLLLSGYYLYVNNKNSTPQKDPYGISVICNVQSADKISVLKAGVDKAADEFNADVSLFTLTKDNDAKQQISLLQREVDNGANAVLIIPAKSDDIVAPIVQANQKIPVIVLQSTVPELSDLEPVSCDNAQLGQSLAEKIIQSEEGTPDVIILNHDSNTELCNHLEAALKTANANISHLDFSHSEPDAINNAKALFMSHRNKIFIAPDRDTLEVLAKAKKNLMESDVTINSHLYGVGRSNAIMSMLEGGIIHAAAVENEYGIGYLSIKSAVDRCRKMPSEDVKVNFAIADSSNMHNPEYEYLLFPLIS